ncbi:MAG: OadG family protein [Eubacterium sp.]|nr:OadG family protein [Eubacterium sp.]
MAEVETSFSQALINTGIGMGTVFCVLILISFIIYLLKFVPGLLGGNKNKAVKQTAAKAPTPAAANQAPTQRPATQEAPVAQADNNELIAVIAAAIAAQMTEETGVAVAPDGLVIRSIKKR